MVKMKVFISGQKYFGEEVYILCKKMGLEVVGVCSPPDDRYLTAAAARDGVKIIPAGSLCADNMPACDLGIAAHSFDYIGKKTRYKPVNGWIGYHPSLLPMHRGRSSIEWAIRMGDKVTGGSVFWLNGGIDRGDIAYQNFCFIPPKYALDPKGGASKLWREELAPMGLELLREALLDISSGILKRQPQRADVSSFEPSLDAIKDIFKPDLLMIGTTVEEAGIPCDCFEDEYIPHC